MRPASCVLRPASCVLPSAPCAMALCVRVISRTRRVCGAWTCLHRICGAAVPGACPDHSSDQKPGLPTGADRMSGYHIFHPPRTGKAQRPCPAKGRCVRGRSCVSPPWSWPWPCCAVALCMEVGQGQNRERALGEGGCWGPGRFVQGISDISASGMSMTPSRHGGRERAMGIRMGIRKPWRLSPRDRSRLLPPPPAIARMFSRMFTRTFVLRYPGAVARALPGFLAPLWQEA